MNQWLKNVKTIDLVWPVAIVVVGLTLWVGIMLEQVPKWVILIPIVAAVPYVAGLLQGIWHRLTLMGERVVYNDGIEAKEIAAQCLKRLGCQPQANDDGSISVSYQGENFHMSFSPRNARIWDPSWAWVKADDPDLPNIKKAVNETNYDSMATVVVTCPDENGMVRFHSRCDVMLHPACPENVQYVKAILDSFFETKERVRGHFQQIAQQEQQAVKQRRPVGFATDNKEEKTDNEEI